VIKLSRSSVKRRTLFAVAFLTALLVIASLALSVAGTSLVIEDPLQHARSVVVFGGQLPFRAMEAAALYRQGWTREVWLTQGGVYEEDLALARLGIDKPPEYAYSREVLEHLGVPDQAIRLIDGQTQNTADEIRAIARELKTRGGDRVILITSKYHARRVKVIWRALVGNRPEAIVRYTPDDPFEPERWWRNTEDAMSVSREWFGLLNAWSGFPVKSERW
jgi:uncharacterized SAM-binding protein YcdF (DUF218 family)